MKNLMLTILVLIIGSLASTQETKGMDSETIMLANMLVKPTFLKCVEQVQKERQAQFVITQIKVSDHKNFEIRGVLLVGGDVAIGYQTLDVTATLEPFFGYIYRCQPRK